MRTRNLDEGEKREALQRDHAVVSDSLCDPFALISLCTLSADYRPLNSKSAVEILSVSFVCSRSIDFCEFHLPLAAMLPVFIHAKFTFYSSRLETIQL